MQHVNQRRSSASLPFTTVSRELATRLEVEAEGLVQHHLRAYEAHLYYQNREELRDPKLWTRVQSSKKGGFSVYRRVRRRTSSTSTTSSSNTITTVPGTTPAAPVSIPQHQQQPQQNQNQNQTSKQSHQFSKNALPTQLLGIGFTIGTIEDMIFGSLAPTTAAIKIQALYTQDPVADAAVLATLVAPNPVSDPLRSVALKWVMKKPKVYGVSRYRDYVFIESIGIRRSVCGERIGYHLMHSIDLPPSEFPPLDDDQEDVVRRRLSSCYLYRGIGSGLIECFLRCTTDPMRVTPEPLVVYAAAQRLLTCCPGFMRVAETNKLIFALQQNLLLKAREAPRARYVCYFRPLGWRALELGYIDTVDCRWIGWRTRRRATCASRALACASAATRASSASRYAYNAAPAAV